MVEDFKTKVGTSDSYKDIIVASLVEREGYDSTDRPIIAGIILLLARSWLLGHKTSVSWLDMISQSPASMQVYSSDISRHLNL